MRKQRFLIIAWPADHDEDINTHACDIQDALMGMMGCPQVIGPIPDALAEEIMNHLPGLDWTA